MNIMASVDGNVFPKDEIIGFKIAHSLSHTCPSGYILLDDRRKLFRQGKILVGSRVQIFSEESKDWLFDMYIDEISVLSADPSTFDGNIMCILKHPLEIFQCVDTSNAWLSETPDKIIEKIIDDNKAYKEFKFLENKDFVPCEKLNHPVYQAYRCGLDFIEQEIIPYLSIEDHPALFYIDYHKKMHLTTMKRLWVEKPEFTIGTPSALSSPRGLQYTAQAKQTPYLTAINFGISPEGNLLRNFRVGFVIPDESTDAVIAGDAKPYIKIDESGKLPISAKAGAIIGDNVTRCIECGGRDTNDCVTLVLNEQKCIYNAIYANASIKSYYPNLDIGKTVYLTSEDKEEKGSFLEDQYLVFEYSAELAGDPGVICGKLTLIKPGITSAHTHVDEKTLANFYTITG